MVVADGRSLVPQQFDDRQDRRLTQVIDILLLGDTQNQNAGAIQRLLLPIQALVVATTW
jgi:hypothetical protein